MSSGSPPKATQNSLRDLTHETSNQQDDLRFAKQTPTATNSSRVCHIRLSGKRKHTSIRCDEAIWQAFKTLCRANGLSTCDILEKLLIGATVGLQTRVAQPTTINVVVDAPRIVKRVRRRQLVIEDEVTVWGFRGCERDAVATGVWRGNREFPLCGKHLAEAKGSPRDWQILGRASEKDDVYG